MNTEQKSVAENCLNSAYNGTLSFPEIISALLAASFEGYLVDYRTNTCTYYLTDGGSLVLNSPQSANPAARRFDQSGVSAAIKWAQSGAADYTYSDFNARVTACGCAGYIVSFPGRRVVYFGRTAEIHVEHFPN